MVFSLTQKKLDEELFQALRAVYQFERLKVSLFELTFEEIFLLQFLRRGSPCRVGIVAEEMKIPVSTLSRAIGRLQARELVLRQPDPGDRRIILVSLSKKGEELVVSVEQHTFELITTNLAKFDTAEISAFLKAARSLPCILATETTTEQKGQN